MRHVRWHIRKRDPPDRRKILRALWKWKKAGHSLSWNVICLENQALALPAKRAFGNWGNAVTAVSNHPVPTRRSKWNPERVIAAIQERRREGKSLTATAIVREGHSLMNAVRRYFGTWRKALAAAGVEPERRGRRRGQ